MLVSSFNLSHLFNFAPYLFSKKRFKSEMGLVGLKMAVKKDGEVLTLQRAQQLQQLGEYTLVAGSTSARQVDK